MEAKRYHFEVPSAEIVGLIPKDALVRSLKYYYAIDNLVFPEEISLNEVVRMSERYLCLRDFSVDKIIDYFL
jgi:glutamate formiminotransferase